MFRECLQAQFANESKQNIFRGTSRLQSQLFRSNFTKERLMRQVSVPQTMNFFQA